MPSELVDISCGGNQFLLRATNWSWKLYILSNANAHTADNNFDIEYIQVCKAIGKPERYELDFCLMDRNIVLAVNHHPVELVHALDSQFLVEVGVYFHSH